MSEPFDCGTCRGEPAPPGTLTAREWDALAARRNVVKLSRTDRFLEALICGECFRFRFSPLHFLRLAYHETRRSA